MIFDNATLIIEHDVIKKVIEIYNGIVLMPATQRKKTKRFETNPFVGDLVVQRSAKMVKISTLGKDDNVLVNQTTGEVSGTHVVTYKKVDKEQFIKVFPAMIGAQFELGPAGIKAFSVLMWAVQHQAIGKDLVCLDKYALEKFRISHPNLKKATDATIRKGLVELEDAQFIAKAERAGDYFINPKLFFNGDRVAFTTVLEKSRFEDKDQIQMSLEN